MALPLTCAYTGKTIHLEPVWLSGSFLGVRARGAWSPCRIFKDEDEARLQMRRRGTEWVAPDAKLCCPYTGVEASFIRVSDGVRPVGVLDTDRIFENTEEAEKALSMRGGREGSFASPVAEVLGETLPEEALAAESVAPTVTPGKVQEIIRRGKKR